MGKPISIDFISDVSSVVADTKTLADRFDDVSDSLKDLATDSKQSAAKVGDSFSDAGKDAKKFGDKVDETYKTAGKDAKKFGDDAERTTGAAFTQSGAEAKSFSRRVDDAFDSIGKTTKVTSKKIETDFTAATKESSEGMEQMAGDAESNATEIAASFDGSAESLIDGFQGAAAEMFSGFGPAGLAAGLAVAAGVGVAVTAANDAADAVNEAAEEVSDLASEIYDLGGDVQEVDFAGRMLEWGLAIQDTRQFWELWQDKAKSGFEVIKEESEKAGTNWKDAFLGAHGPMEASQKFLTDTDKTMAELNETIEKNQKVTANGGPVNAQAAQDAMLQRTELVKQREAAEKNIDTQQDAIDVAKMATEINGDSTSAIEAKSKATEDEAKATDDAKRAVEEKNDAEREAAGINKDALTSQMDYTDKLKATTDEIIKNGQATDINTEAGKANNRALIDLAGAGTEQLSALEAQGVAASVLTEKTNATRDAFVAQAIAAGYNKDEALKLAESLGLIPPEVKTIIGMEGGVETKAAVDAIPDAKDVAVEVDDGGTKDKTDKGIQAIKDKKVDVKVSAGRTVSDVQTQINGIKGRTVDVRINLTNLGSIQETLRQLTLPRSVDVTVNERPGKRVN